MDIEEGRKLLKELLGVEPHPKIVSNFYRTGVLDQYARGGVKPDALAAHYWLAHEDYIQPASSSRKPPVVIPPDERGRAMGEILAQDAAKELHLIAFRKEEMGNRLIKATGIERWLKSRSGPGGTYKTKDIPGYKGDKPVTVKRGGHFIHYDIPGQAAPGIVEVYGSATLKRLERLAGELAAIYPWRMRSAITFILTGEVPLLYRAKVSLTLRNRYRALDRITMELDPRMKPVEVQKLYAEHRRALGGAVKERSRGMTSEKQLTLALFLHQYLSSDKKWDEIRESWNRKYPTWTYDNYPEFSIDSKKAWQRVTGNTWPGKGSK